MKILNKILGMAFVLFMLTSCAPGKIMAQQEGEYISDQQFYDELQPYGTWVYDDKYGNVWIPDVDEDFRPYATRGYWAMTDAGNTWVSDYPWGWATFHYGRWHYDNYYGWEWSPGSEWAPAWVTWRDGGGYYGWAPMEPNINYDTYYDDNSYAVNDNYWVFAPYAYINYPNVYNYYVPRNRVSVIIRNTNWVRNRYTYNNHNYYSPGREDIQRNSGRPVRVYNINNVNRPSRITVNNNNINIYRPGVRTNANARPTRVVDGAAYRQQNPGQLIGGGNDRSTRYNPGNASKLAEAARTTNPDGKIVRLNNNNANVDGRPQRTNPVNTGRPITNPGNVTPDNNGRNRGTRPSTNGDVQQQRNLDRQQGDVQRQQMREQQRQVRDQQRQQQQQATQQQTDQQKQVADQQRQQQQQARDQQRQQWEQQRQQQMNRGTRSSNDDAQAQQQREQVRQQQEQQRQQQAQQQEQMRQQQQQARQQQEQQQRDQARQQQDQQRQQQQEQARQQQQQQREQMRQQQEQQRQQQQDQARQQQEQQRQQQQEQARQQRQQQEQQRQQQQPRESSGGGRPVRN